jgi:hypothetical protein
MFYLCDGQPYERESGEDGGEAEGEKTGFNQRAPPAAGRAGGVHLVLQRGRSRRSLLSPSFALLHQQIS